jgi:hypothetical protein
VRPGLGKPLRHGAYAALAANLSTGPIRLRGRGSYRRRLSHGRPLDRPVPDWLGHGRCFIRGGRDREHCGSKNFTDEGIECLKQIIADLRSIR